MTHAPRLRTIVPLALLALGVSACSQPSRPRASAAIAQKCRMEVDRVYAAQNRVDLSLRDTRDTPFASNYNSGITTRGLGAQFGRDNMTQACVSDATTGAAAAAASPAANTGPTFTTTPTSTAR
ncbi:MAG: hypothetical protein ACRYGM_02540 [Janthinobacterium lividum]